MLDVLATVREALLDTWALIQPIECLGCGAPDRALCPVCRRALAPVRAGRVRCDADPGAPVWVGADYLGAVRGAILALKDDARTDALRPLGRCLRAAVAAALEATTTGVELVAVPTTAAALRRRGHDPVRGIVAAAGLPSARVLRARRGAGPQKALGRAGRLAAAGGRFSATGRLDGRRFLLVDDVVTTGATLAACAEAIRAAGGEIVAAAALAAPDRSRRELGPDR